MFLSNVYFMTIEKQEIRNAVKQAVDLIDATATAKDIMPGEAALEQLRSEKRSPITNRAALFVKARELVKQNPSRKK